jgi:hypothetical protein
MPNPIREDDLRYSEAEYQEFSTFEEGEKFLRDYCARCRLEQECEINHRLRHAMGENYPIWEFDNFIKIKLKSCVKKQTCCSDSENNPPRSLVVCRMFSPQQLELAF